MDLRTQPLRLERALTQDYINRAVKMREITERIEKARARPFRTAACWLVVLAGLSAWIYLNL